MPTYSFLPQNHKSGSDKILGSEDKGVKCDDLTSNPENPHNGKREPTAANCPLTSTHALWHACTQNK